MTKASKKVITQGKEYLTPMQEIKKQKTGPYKAPFKYSKSVGGKFFIYDIDGIPVLCIPKRLSKYGGLIARGMSQIK